MTTAVRGALVLLLIGVTLLASGLVDSGERARSVTGTGPWPAEAIAQGFPGAPSPTATLQAGTCARAFGVSRVEATTRVGEKAIPTPGAREAQLRRSDAPRWSANARGQTRTVVAEAPYGPAPTMARAALDPAAGWKIITCETFEGVDFPNWTTIDNDGALNGEYCWDVVPYQARFGFYSIWPAAGCADAVSPATHFYPDNADSWLVYGPFSLADAHEAHVRFSLWHQLAGDGSGTSDRLFVGASIDGGQFFGFNVFGRSTEQEPPTPDGWKDLTLDLAEVPLAGSLLGAPQVWLAWRFVSDAAGVDDGPFVDDVLVAKRTGSATVPTQVTAPPTGSPTRTPTPTVTRTATRTPTPTPTPTPPAAINHVSLRVDPAGAALAWGATGGESGFIIARFSSMGNALLPPAGPLPASATGFVDATPPPGAVCYVVVGFQGAPPAPSGASGAVCRMAGTRTIVGAPQSFTISFASPGAVSLSWQPPPGAVTAGYILLPFARPPIALPPTATAMTDAITEPTCYMLLAHRDGGIQGATDVLCVIPTAT